MTETTEINDLLKQEYVPSSVERKKALLTYVFFGIFMSLMQKNLSVYQVFHLKQAIGRWIVFFLCLIVSAFLIFLPYLRVLPWLLFIILLVFFFIFVRQAYKGQYFWDQKVVFPLFFGGLGGWALQVFEYNYEQFESPQKIPDLTLDSVSNTQTTTTNENTNNTNK